MVVAPATFREQARGLPVQHTGGLGLSEPTRRELTANAWDLPLLAAMLRPAVRQRRPELVVSLFAGVEVGLLAVQPAHQPQLWVSVESNPAAAAVGRAAAARHAPGMPHTHARDVSAGQLWPHTVLPAELAPLAPVLETAWWRHRSGWQRVLTHPYIACIQYSYFLYFDLVLHCATSIDWNKQIRICLRS